MKELELFRTYNGITKKYIVMAVTIQDLLNDPKYKDNKSLLLLAKPDVVPPRPRKKRKQKSRLDRIEQLLNKFIKEQTVFNATISQKLDNIVKLNNLKAE